MILNNSELSTGLLVMAQSEGLPCSTSFEKSPCLLAHTESQPEGMVETTSKNIRHDPQAVLNVVVRDSVQKVGYDSFAEL